MAGHLAPPSDRGDVRLHHDDHHETLGILMSSDTT